MPAYHAYGKGLNFRPQEVRTFVTDTTYPASVQLIRDPFNHHDPNAIEVHLDGIHICFIDKNIAEWLAPRMDLGEAFSAVADTPETHGKAVWLPITIEPTE